MVRGDTGNHFYLITINYTHMEEIENKLQELLVMLEQSVPNECRGESKEAHDNRGRFLQIRRAIRSLFDDK